MSETQEKIFKWSGVILGFLAATGIIGVLFSNALQKFEESSNNPVL